MKIHFRVAGKVLNSKMAFVRMNFRNHPTEHSAGSIVLVASETRSKA